MAGIGKGSRTMDVTVRRSGGAAHEPAGTPGKSTLAGALPPIPVQRKADGSAGERVDNGAVHEAAAAGVRGGGDRLPYLEKIQASFGPAHDVVRALPGWTKVPTCRPDQRHRVLGRHRVVQRRRVQHSLAPDQASFTRHPQPSLQDTVGTRRPAQRSRARMSTSTVCTNPA